MAGAIIVIDQPGGAGAGSPGVARNDLWQNQQVNLSCATINGSYQWDLLDIPPGSGASLVGEGTSTPNFLPDLVGTYRVQLITNGGGPGNVQILVLRVRYSQTGVLQKRGWALPAVGEQGGEANYGGNVRGWAEVWEYIAADLQTLVQGQGQLLLPTRDIVPGFSGVASTQETASGGQVIGCFSFDPSAYPPEGGAVLREIHFRAILEASAATTAQVILYNLDAGEAVTGGTLVATGPGAKDVLSSMLDVGDSPRIPNTSQLYELRLRISSAAPGPSDFAICKGAAIELHYTEA